MFEIFVYIYHVWMSLTFGFSRSCRRVAHAWGLYVDARRCKWQMPGTFQTGIWRRGPRWVGRMMGRMIMRRRCRVRSNYIVPDSNTSNMVWYGYDHNYQNHMQAALPEKMLNLSGLPGYQSYQDFSGQKPFVLAFMSIPGVTFMSMLFLHFSHLFSFSVAALRILQDAMSLVGEAPAGAMEKILW